MTPLAPSILPPRRAAVVFAAFAFAYFLSALLRAVTATLAPQFSSELGLGAGALGLLGGAYFLGFAAMQLPLGHALDRVGPRRVVLALLALAVAGCLAFAAAGGLWALIASRTLIGVGVSACLMAPLTCYRLRFTAQAQLRANSWMLMAGSLGMVASTLPVQALLPLLGWRGLFVAVAGLLVISMLVIAAGVPRDAGAPAGDETGRAGGADGRAGYREIVRHPLFRRMAPLGFTLYGGLVAVQSLWAGPWLTRVAGVAADAAAGGLFVVNLCMLFAFLAWGAAMPRLAARGWGAVPLMTAGVPLALALLGLILVLGPAAGAAHWAAWCVACTVVSLSQPAVGSAFPPALAGRALSAFNLVVFAGVFCVQWGIGLAVDALRAAGLDDTAAFRGAFAAFGLACAAAYGWFLAGGRGADGAHAPAQPGPHAAPGARARRTGPKRDPGR